MVFQKTPENCRSFLSQNFNFYPALFRGYFRLVGRRLVGRRLVGRRLVDRRLVDRRLVDRRLVDRRLRQ